MNRRSLLVLSTFLSLAFATRADVPAIRLAGSATVTRAIQRYKPGVEASHNVSLHLLPVGSGRGLSELAARRVEVAMVAGAFPSVLERASRAGTALSLPQLELLKLPALPQGEVIALVHPANPLRHLRAEQIRAIFAGEFDNWSQCGGDDRPIVVVLQSELDDLHAAIADALLGPLPYATKVRLVDRTGDVPAAVAQEPGAVGLVVRGCPSEGAAQIEPSPSVNIPLFLVALRPVLEEDAKLEIVLNALHSRAR